MNRDRTINADFRHYPLVLTGTKVILYSKAENQQITMRASYLPQPDNNVLSTVSSVNGYADWMQFFWKDFY